MTPIATLLGRLEGVRQRGPHQWSARCPAHADRSPSLSVRELDDGRVIVHCFAQCGAEAVLAALELTFSDLYPEPLEPREKRTGRDRINYKAILELAAREILAVRLTVADILAERPISEEHERRIEVAQHRLEAIWRHANVP